MPMDILTEDLIKLGIAIFVGGIVGAEREFRDKAAGFRTLILITVGSKPSNRDKFVNLLLKDDQMEEFVY